MLFSKKPTRENTKIRLRALETEPVRAKLPPRLAMSLAAPFVIVALFLWVFFKQTSFSTSKKASERKTAVSTGETSDVAQAPPTNATKDQESPRGASLPPAPMPAPEASESVKVKTDRPKKSVEQNEAVKTPVEPRSSQKTVLPKDAAIPNKKEAPEVKKSNPQIASKLTPIQPVQKDVQKIRIKEGRPFSPREMQAGGKIPKAVTTPQKGVAEQGGGSLGSGVPPLESEKNTTSQKSAGRSYKIQAGSFQSKEDAEKLAFRLKERGYDVSITIAKIPHKGDWYRVRVGHYADRALAEKEGSALASAEHLSFFITSDP